MNQSYRAVSRQPPAGRTLAVSSGQFVFREGDLGTEMYIIQEGQIEILHRVADRQEPLALLEKGDFFGEMSLLEDLPRSASARARTDVKLIRIDGATLDSMLRRNPEIGVRIMRKLSRRVRDTDELLKEALGEVQLEAQREGEGGSTPEEVPKCDLVHQPSGRTFPLSGERLTTIGRRDPVTGIQPDVDLTEIDDRRSSSRRHAKIYRDADAYFLVEDIGAVNGTFVNDNRVRAGASVELRPGDLLRFGVVEMVFRGP